jgi:hypothetical protein
MPWVPPCSLTAHPVAARRLRAGELIRQSVRSTPKGLAISEVRVGLENKPNSFGKLVCLVCWAWLARGP